MFLQIKFHIREGSVTVQHFSILKEVVLLSLVCSVVIIYDRMFKKDNTGEVVSGLPDLHTA